MTTLEPGLYKATVRGVPDQMVMVAIHDAWTLQSLGGYVRHARNDITDARPLIVLDLANWAPSRAGLAADVLRGLPLHATGTGHFLADVLTQIEAQSKPPRIPEPGLWGVVEAKAFEEDTRRVFTRLPSRNWNLLTTTQTYSWPSLIDPVLVRDGIEP